MRFGFPASRGTDLGISAERARRLEEQVLGRLARSPELAVLREAV